MEIEKTNRMNALFEFYAALLTDKQMNYIELYYADDYSLAEIAEEFGEIDPLVERRQPHVVLAAQLLEIPALLLLRRSHKTQQMFASAIVLADSHDTPLDNRFRKPEIAAMAVVIRLYLLVGYVVVHLRIEIVLLDFADKQRLAVVVHHAVNIGCRRREHQFSLLQLQLLDYPLFDIRIHVIGAVRARKPFRQHGIYIGGRKLLLADTSQHFVAGENGGRSAAGDCAKR